MSKERRWPASGRLSRKLFSGLYKPKTLNILEIVKRMNDTTISAGRTLGGYSKTIMIGIYKSKLVWGRCDSNEPVTVQSPD